MKKNITHLILFAIFLLFSFINPAQAGQGRVKGIKVIHKDPGIYIFKINTKRLGGKIKPLAADELISAKEVFSTGNYNLVVNGGFFDMKTGGEISYVIIDDKIAQSPYNNEKLINDLTSNERLEAVLNRTELRVVSKKNGRLGFQIANHNEQTKKEGDKIIHSLQAGPRIMPKLDTIDESFIKYDESGKVVFDTISVTKRRARTILALKRNKLYIVIFTNSDRKTLKEVKDFCDKKNFKNAMALDGGGSTSLYYDNIEIYSEGTGQNPGRKVKSFLVIEK